MNFQKVRKDIIEGKLDIDSLQEKKLEIIDAYSHYMQMKVLTNEEFDSLLEMLKTSTSNIVKTYGFMLLVKAKYPLEVSFEKNGENFHMIPCKTLLPFEEEKAKTLVSMLQKEMKDPSLFHIATTLLNNYMFELYPLSIFDKYSLENLFACFVILSHEYLQSAFDEETFLKDNFLQKEEVELVKKDVSSVLKNAEQMKV